MDIAKYDKLRKKINKKDFEGNNKGLDKWLYRFSFVGNAGSIFFSYFLLYPALLKAITINMISGFWGIALAFVFTTTFLVIFEIIKRYLFRNFSSDYVANNKKINPSIAGWFAVSLAIVVLSFYLSLVGSKNLASTSEVKNNIVQTKVDNDKNLFSLKYENEKKIYENDNIKLREINNNLRQTLSETPINYTSVRRDYQSNIDKNTQAINDNQLEIKKIEDKLNQKTDELKFNFIYSKAGNAAEDSSNIVLFIIIAIFSEIIIIGGVYFREFYEYNLYVINQQKFDKIYLKKDRYKALLTFIYNNGKLQPGDKVISGLEIKAVVAEKTVIKNSNKIIEEFLHDMDRLNIFSTVGKRRYIAATYNDAINIIEHFDDTLRVLENMK